MLLKSVQTMHSDVESAYELSFSPKGGRRDTDFKKKDILTFGTFRRATRTPFWRLRSPIFETS